jgi:hypothetical protein
MPEHLSDTTNQPSEFADPEASGRETKTLTNLKFQLVFCTSI